jgi:hypothetical protein
MPNRFWWAVFFLLGLILLDRVVFAEMTLFDFNQAPTSPKRRANNYIAIESYMEGLFGSDITVSQGTTAVMSMGYLGTSDMTLAGGLAPSISSPDALLLNGKGRNSGLVLSFGSSPIHSFAVDWEVFKKGTGLIIKADGVVIYENLLTKSERKTGIMDHLAPVYFDQPIHTLEFIGLGKTRIGIDNLAVNIPLPSNGSENPSSSFPFTDSEGAADNQESGDDYSGAPKGFGGNGNQDGYPDGWNGDHDGGGPYRPVSERQVPEPSTFILLAVGLLAIRVGKFMSRRSTQARR